MSCIAIRCEASALLSAPTASGVSDLLDISDSSCATGVGATVENVAVPDLIAIIADGSVTEAFTDLLKADEYSS
jgi:hypothetical protein